MNICEITSNNSTLSDFDHPAWQLGRGYGDRVLNDIQQGLRGWSEMPNYILPDVFLHVKDMVDMQTNKKDEGNLHGGGRGKKGAGSQPRSTSDKGVKVGEKPLVCSSYNDFSSALGVRTNLLMAESVHTTTTAPSALLLLGTRLPTREGSALALGLPQLLLLLLPLLASNYCIAMLLPSQQQ